MIYLTGSSGLIGKKLKQKFSGDIAGISYRDKVYDLFAGCNGSCLVHLGWSTTTRSNSPEVSKADVDNSRQLFEYYANKNPNGKIIFISTAGDLHRDNNTSEPIPHSLYGQSKLEVENILNGINCNSVIFRVTNVWGGEVYSSRVNGLPDKLIKSLDTHDVTDIYANLKTQVDLIHVDDLVNLIIKAYHCNLLGHKTFLVGSQNITIGSIIDKISRRGNINLRINQKADRSFLNIDNTEVKEFFDWTPHIFLT